MIAIEENEGLRGTLPGIQPGASNCDPLSKIVCVLNYMRTRQGSGFCSIILRTIVHDNDLGRKLSSFQYYRGDCRTFVESRNGHEDFCVRKSLAQDCGDRRRRFVEHFPSYSSVRRPTRKPMLPSEPPDGGNVAIRVLPTFSKSDGKTSRSHCPFWRQWIRLEMG